MINRHLCEEQKKERATRLRIVGGSRGKNLASTMNMFSGAPSLVKTVNKAEENQKRLETAKIMKSLLTELAPNEMQ